MQGRQVRCWLLFAVVCTAAMLASTSCKRTTDAEMLWFSEHCALDELSDYLSEGNRTAGQIRTFDEFARKVLEARGLVSVDAKAENPFPSVLPGRDYGRTYLLPDGVAAEELPLMWTMPIGKSGHLIVLFWDGTVRNEGVSANSVFDPVRLRSLVAKAQQRAGDTRIPVRWGQEVKDWRASD